MDFSYASTFEEIAEQLDNPDCNEVILGYDTFDEDDEYKIDNNQIVEKKLSLIYVKYTDVYIYRTTDDGVITIEHTICEPFVKRRLFGEFPDKLLDEIKDYEYTFSCLDYDNHHDNHDNHHLWYFNGWYNDKVFKLIELMYKNNWTLPQIEEWKLDANLLLK